MITPELLAARRQRIIGPRFLPGTKTHEAFGDRKYQMEIPHPDCLGRITIVMGKKSESYLFDEDYEFRSRPGSYGRSFLFGRITGGVTDRRPGFYRVTIHPSGKYGGCDCPGFDNNKTCKHVDVVLDLLTVPDSPIASAETATDEQRQPDHLPAYRDEW